MNLYTYLPKDNTADTEGLLSTRLAPSGWEKYKGRTGKDTKDEVLETLDSWEPGFARSKAISMFSEPIPEYADKRMVEFAKAKHLYSVQALLAGNSERCCTRKNFQGHLGSGR